MASNKSSTDASARRTIRRLAGEDSTNQQIAYEDNGATRNVQGDEEAPWVKVPPFTESPPEPYITSEQLPSSNAYVVLPEIDVSDSRLLTLYVDYTAASAGNDGQLSIIPQASRDDSGDSFFSIPVIDPTLTLVSCTGFTPQIGSRNVYPAELRTEALADTVQLVLPLPFDVAPYSRFRFLMAELGAGTAGTITLAFARSM
jgi:hypothetical protein